MSLPSGRLLLLDTCILVHLVRDDAEGKRLESRYWLSRRGERPLISTITEGEIRGLALGWGWGPQKLQELDRLVGELISLPPATRDIVDAYAMLYHDATRRGHAAGENDLWIAATARAVGAVLLTVDKDFDWMHPDYVTVEKVTLVR